MANRLPRAALVPAGVLCLIAILAAELAFSVRRQSQTFDEGCHIFAGYEYWRSRDYGVNPEHPPLVKLAATLPLLHLRLLPPPMPEDYFKGSCFRGAFKFLYSNDAETMLFLSRMAASIFTLILALMIFEVAYSMFGAGPAFLALVLFVFEPNILAHGALVTTDLGVACCMFAAVYAFFRYVTRPSVLRLAGCGFLTGLALAAKHSGVLVFPILFLLAIAEVALGSRAGVETPHGPRARPQEVLRLAGALLLIGVIALTLLWSFYGFRFQARPGNLKIVPSLPEFVQTLNHPVEARIILRLARWRLLPESYLYGLADVALANDGRPAFILGKLYASGRWFYFPAVFLIKSTLGLLSLLLIAFAAKKFRRREFRREALFLAVPAVFYFAVSMTSGLNIGVRHILPVYPFLVVLAAAGAWSVAEGHSRMAYVVAALVAFQIFSSVRAYPDYLAYSNEFAGGPARTYKLLADSDVDWGQGLKAAKAYLDRKGISDCWFAYNGSADTAYYRIPCRLLPDPYSPMFGRSTNIVPRTVQGTLLISATETTGKFSGPAELNPYGEFRVTRPLENLGGSILVFEGRFDLSLASALGHVNKSWELAYANKMDQAMAEARESVSLAPKLVQSHYTLAYLQAQAGHKADARLEYQTALSLARTIHPEFQSFWIPFLERALQGL